MRRRRNRHAPGRDFRERTRKNVGKPPGFSALSPQRPTGRRWLGICRAGGLALLLRSSGGFGFPQRPCGGSGLRKTGGAGKIRTICQSEARNLRFRQTGGDPARFPGVFHRARLEGIAGREERRPARSTLSGGILRLLRRMEQDFHRSFPQAVETREEKPERIWGMGGGGGLRRGGCGKGLEKRGFSWGIRWRFSLLRADAGAGRCPETGRARVEGARAAGSAETNGGLTAQARWRIFRWRADACG